MLESMPARMLREWWEYASIEPWGEYRNDLRSGVIASTIYNVNRGRGTRARKPTDFVLSRQDTATSASTESGMRAILQQLSAKGIGQWQTASSAT